MGVEAGAWRADVGADGQLPDLLAFDPIVADIATRVRHGQESAHCSQPVVHVLPIIVYFNYYVPVMPRPPPMPGARTPHTRCPNVVQCSSPTIPFDFSPCVPARSTETLLVPFPCPRSVTSSSSS